MGLWLRVGASVIRAVPLSERDATSAGAARSVREASSVVGARGIISVWPLRTRDFTDRLLASARSARLTWSLRAMVASDSPLRTVYHFSAAISPGPASARRAWNWSPVPVGTFNSKVGYFTGVVQRRSCGLSA